MHRIQIDDEIVLRIPNIKDAENFFAVIDRNREYLGEWLDFVPKTTSVEVTRGVIERWQKQADEASSFNYLIEYCGSIIGAGGATRLNQPQNLAELGYWLTEEMQGRGIATRFCRALLHLVFEERKVNRVEVRVAATNMKSRAVVERLGFILEGYLRDTAYFRGEYIDNAVYSILARDYSES